MTTNTATSLADYFPSSPRIFYGKAPLTQVICQLRFPSLLRIEGEPPAAFQEKIRNLFPLLERAAPVPQEIPAEIIQAMGIANVSTSFSFKTEDNKTIINLSSDAIALTTTAYTRWENFVSFLKPALDALVEIYQPSFFHRVGLRYVNVITRSAVGLTDTPWSKLIRKDVLGELALSHFERNVTEARRNLRFLAPADGCAVYFQHGLAKLKQTNETTYRLDFDFYKDQKTEVADAQPTIDKFNSMVGRAFRWSITEPLHKALEPHPIELDQRPGRRTK